MSNILLRLGIRPVVLHYFSPYLETLTEDTATFPYQYNGRIADIEIFQHRKHTIPEGQMAWTVHPPFAPAVNQHFLFYSALESLCFFSLHPRWLHCPASIAVSAIGLSPKLYNFTRLLTTFPNAQLHLAFGNDLPGRLMDCQIPLSLKGRYWHFACHHDLIHINDGWQTCSIAPENFSSTSLLKPGYARRFKKEKPRGGFNSFYEQLQYPLWNG